MRLLLAILITLSVACSSVRADLLDDAIQAHRAGIPEVSITKLRQFLATNRRRFVRKPREYSLPAA